MSHYNAVLVAHWSAYYHSLPNSFQHPNDLPFPSLTHYPESSQRTILTSSPDVVDTAAALHPIYDHRRSHSSDYNRWDTVPPTVDEFHYPLLEMHTEDTEDVGVHTESRQTSPPASISSLHPSVKVEPEDPDGCFIMELSSMSPTLGLSLGSMNQALAPPTEVPLRATQASKEMRKMMGVFRLNPFAMHTGEGRGIMPAPWCGGGPLEEEPLIFEFQLDIDDDPRDRQFDYVGMCTSPSPTDSLGTEEEAQLRSFSPSFELHPEDLRSEIGEEHEQEPEEYTEPDQQNEWSDADYGNQSEVDTSSTTHSVHTPSETRSAHTPFNESSVFQYPTPPPAASTWDIDSYQPHCGEEHLPQQAEKMEGGHKMHRVHTTTSHPYLRKGLQASPSSSSPHSLCQSHLELNYGYPALQQTTTHHHHHYNNQVPSQSYSESQHPSFHASMVSAAPLPNLELIPVVPSHTLEDGHVMSNSYMRSGRTLKLALEDETSTLHHHHHHPAGIVNEYSPRGMACNTYTGQQDTQYETMQQHSSSSNSGHVLSPSRRWSLPETLGGPFRGTT